MKRVNTRVLDIVSYQYLPFVSGGQKNIGFFLEYLGETTSLHVAGTTDNQNSFAKNYVFYPVLSSSKIRYIDITSIFRVRKIIRQHQINIIIIEHPYIGWLGVALKLLTGAELIIRTHNIEYERFRSIGKWWWRLLQTYETWVLNRADKIFSISDEDKSWMINKMGIPIKKCITVPYGITQETIPYDKQLCKELVCQRHGLDKNKELFFFNGSLDYKPNKQALKDIIQKVNPLLLKSGINYNILIAGKNLPPEFDDLKRWNADHIFYTGFVEDIDQYTKAADLFLNPVNTGGGVKTKMIEALGMGVTVVATKNGAIGVDKYVCGEKLKIVENDDWKGFAEMIKASLPPRKETPQEFYEKYNWRNITKMVNKKMLIDRETNKD